MRFTGLVLFVVLAPLLVLSCAITSGTTFSRVVDAESSSASSADSQTQSPPDDDVVLSVRTSPSNASVWLDSDYLGTTPLDVEDLAPGTYRLRIDKDGYYSVRRWIEIEPDTALALEIDLQQITGYLAVDVTPPGAQILVGGDRTTSEVVELPVGSHLVRVRLFGYVEQTARVQIRENRVTRLRVELEPAPFELSRVETSRSRFNPENPGATGFVRVSFEVSGPGSGSVRVRNEDGNVVQTIPLPRFTTWEQSFQWPDGQQKQSLPDGSYSLELDLVGSDGLPASRSVTVDVDSSLLVRYRSIWHGDSGLLYAPAPSPLPGGNFQISLEIAGVATEIAGFPVARFPMKLGARVGLGSDLELALYGSLLASSGDYGDRVGGGFALSWSPLGFAWGPVRLSAGIIGGASVRTPDSLGVYAGTDTFTDFPGFSLAVPLTVGFGPVALTGSAEVRLAPAPVTYESATLENGWTPYGYARIGAYADIKSVTAGISAAFRTTPLTAGIALELPFQAGVELHWVLPGSSLALSTFAAGEFESGRDFYIMGGGGIGILF